MTIDWSEVKKALSPIKSYEDLCQRWQESLSHSFVRRIFNKSMPGLMEYTRLGIGSDPRHRYDDYTTLLITLLTDLNQAGVRDIIDLFTRFKESKQLEALAEESGLPVAQIASLMKYLTYWFIPGSKYLGTLVRFDPEISAAVKVLQGHGIRTNLNILEAGETDTKRLALAEISGLALTIIEGLINRADFSRMPWASKATISNIIGAGYTSLKQLTQADPEQLHQDFFRYGKSIGKNLKLGNEIENSRRIAKIMPVILQD